jgi:hypothetical protein
VISNAQQTRCNAQCRAINFVRGSTCVLRSVRFWKIRRKMNNPLSITYFFSPNFLSNCLAFHAADFKNLNTTSHRYSPSLQDVVARFWIRCSWKAKQLDKKCSSGKNTPSPKYFIEHTRPKKLIWREMIFC